MDRRVPDGLVAAKRLAYLLTFGPQSFMTIQRIIIDIGENMSRGGVYSVPPLGIPMLHILKQKIGVKVFCKNFAKQEVFI